MLSIPDMALLGAAALLLFGPEQLPRVARKAGTVMREIQNTSSAFIREMERAADLADAPVPDPIPYGALHEPAEPPAHEPAADHAVAHESVMHAFSARQPPGEEPGAGSPAAEAGPERDHPPHV